MSETSTRTPVPAAATAPAARSIRGRIGPDASSGYYAAPHRYQLFLSLSCPHCLRIAVTHSLLRLEDTVTLTLLPGLPDADGGYASLRPPYESTWHGHTGPATVPVLSDRWTGRIVSNHAPDIMRDLALRFRGTGGPELFPPSAEGEIGALIRLVDEDVTEAARRAGEGACEDGSQDGGPVETLLAALDGIEDRLAAQPFLLGETLTAADVQLWVALLELDTVHRWHLGADIVLRIAAYPRLWAYARRLRDEPAFHTHLNVAGITRRHHHQCRGQEAAGAAVQIIDWTPQELCTPVSPHH